MQRWRRRRALRLLGLSSPFQRSGLGGEGLWMQRWRHLTKVAESSVLSPEFLAGGSAGRYVVLAAVAAAVSSETRNFLSRQLITLAIMLLESAAVSSSCRCRSDCVLMCVLISTFCSRALGWEDGDRPWQRRCTQSRVMGCLSGQLLSL